MLNMSNQKDIERMRNYYRTGDMINLIDFFPKISPIRDLTIVEDEKDFIENKEYLETLDNNRVDSLKGRPVILGIENTGRKEEFLPTLLRVKKKDPQGVLVLFNVINKPSERYERYAGISVGVDIGESVYIDAVGKGFDGREVSKSICTHERYYIPWFQLRSCCVDRFKQFQTYQINQEDYKKSRLDRVKFLESLGLDYKVFSQYIPETYEPIPDFIWLHVIRNIIKKLEKKEEILFNSGFSHFAISGHTEGKEFCPWQMFDKSRYELVKKK